MEIRKIPLPCCAVVIASPTSKNGWMESPSTSFRGSPSSSHDERKSIIVQSRIWSWSWGACTCMASLPFGFEDPTFSAVGACENLEVPEPEPEFELRSLETECFSAATWGIWGAAPVPRAIGANTASFKRPCGCSAQNNNVHACAPIVGRHMYLLFCCGVSISNSSVQDKYSQPNITTYLTKCEQRGQGNFEIPSNSHS